MDHNSGAPDLNATNQPTGSITRSVQLGLLLFVVLPCLPGLIFLLSGLLCDPRLGLSGRTSREPSRYTHARDQASQLYLAGGTVLLVGTMCSGFVVWKIARPSPLIEEEDGTGQEPPGQAAHGQSHDG